MYRRVAIEQSAGATVSCGRLTGGRLTLSEFERSDMGVFFDVVRSDPAAVKSLAGSHRQKGLTDQQCEGCGRWFTNRGISSHRENCVIDEDPELVFVEEIGAVEAMVCRECGRRVDHETPVRGPKHAEGCSRHPSNRPEATGGVTPAEAVAQANL